MRSASAGVVELVDALDSKSSSARSVGSIPTARTNQFAGSAKPAARGLEPASAERFGLDVPRSAARNDNQTVFPCWHLADHPGCSHRHRTTARSVNLPFTIDWRSLYQL
jgi:hypothetical protein